MRSATGAAAAAIGRIGDLRCGAGGQRRPRGRPRRRQAWHTVALRCMGPSAGGSLRNEGPPASSESSALATVVRSARRTTAAASQ